MSWELRGEDFHFTGMPEENKQHLFHFGFFCSFWIQEGVMTLSITCNWTKIKGSMKEAVTKGSDNNKHKIRLKLNISGLVCRHA